MAGWVPVCPTGGGPTHKLIHCPLEALADAAVNIQMITTSEIKVSVVIDEKYLDLAVRALHSAFGLDTPVNEEA